jgi:transposase
MTVPTQREECTAAVGGRLLMSMELSRRQWKLGFTTGAWDNARAGARCPPTRRIECGRRSRPPSGGFSSLPTRRRYEAGRDGFWIHRYLTSLGVENLMVDSSSIEVNRRARRAKTDRMDVEKLLAMLLRYVDGEQTVWRIVRVPSEADERRRQLHRELLTSKRDRVRVMNRIAGLLATVGVLLNVDARFRVRLDRLRQWNGQPLPEALRVRLAREWQKVELLTTRIHDLERARRARLRESRDEAVALVRRLLQLRGIGDNAAGLYVMELFAWRGFRNRRQVGAGTGLVGTPYKSGTLDHEQGISKAGNRRVRTMAVQIAWGWLTYQRQSALTRWYDRRFAHGGPRARKIGIVAVARRLVIDLWHYLDAGVIPEGAVLKPA